MYLISKLAVYVRWPRPTKTTNSTILNQLCLNQLALNWLLKKAELLSRLIRIIQAILQANGAQLFYTTYQNRYSRRVFKDAPPNKNIGL